MANHTQKPNAGFFRRMGAWLFDSLFVIVIEIVGATIVNLIFSLLNKVGLFQYGYYTDSVDFLVHHPIASPLFTAYCAFLWIGFFVFFWVKGQTIGMRIWGLTIVNEQGAPITVTQALIRLFTSAFGLSNLTVLFDPKKRGFHDVWAKTRVIELNKA